MELRFVVLLVLQFTTFWGVSGENCQKRTAPSNYCRKECKTDRDCKRSKKCLCDGNCGLSCIRQGMQCDDNAFEAPRQGKRSYQGRKFGDIIKYTCRKGYTLSGTAELYCSGIGRWKPIQKVRPTCLRQCPKPPAIDNGKVVGTNYGPGKTVSVRCFPGYEVKGSRTISCGEDLQWIQRFPSCQVLGCPPPVLPEKAVFRSGRRDSYLYGDEVVLRCLPGYFSRKTMKMLCVGNRWSSRQYKCYPKSCGSPPRIDNGYFQGRLFTFRKTVRYRCNKGYNLVGPRYRNCQANQKWSENDPTCKIVRCGSKPSLPNGKYVGIGDAYGSALRVQCDVGYFSEGKNEIRCQENGKWSTGSSKCKEIPKNCNNPPAIDNLVYRKYFVDHGKSAEFTCTSGVTKVIGKALKCEDGEFIGERPVCKKDIKYVGCYEARTSMAYYSDLKSFKAQRIEECITTCLRHSKPYAGLFQGHTCHCWISSNPTESRNDERMCSTPCTFNSQLNCGGRSWMSVYKTGCYNPKSPANGNSINKVYENGEIAKYSCNSGYEQEGDGQTCQNLEWVGSRPRCQRVSCGLPVGDLFEPVGNAPTRFGDVIELSCVAGYEMKGNPEIQCKSDGQWSTLPNCKLSSLRKKAYIGCFTWNERMSQLATLPSESTRHRKSCLSLCKRKSFKFAGLLGVYCLCSYSIMMSERQRDCDQKVKVYAVGDCNDPPYVANGNWKRDGQGVNSRVIYECDTGYKLIGVKRRRCLSSLKWDETSPNCEAELCPHPLATRNMALTVYGYTHGSYADINCDTGYTREGPATIKCLHEKWQPLTTSCLAPCHGDLSDSNGRWVYSSRNLLHHSTARLRCRNGYRVRGNANYTCQNGHWKGIETPGKCETVLLRCPPLKKPIAGMVRLYDGNGMKRAIFMCQRGYQLQGTKQLICTHNRWNGYEPKCAKNVKSSPFACPISKEQNAAKEVSDSAPSTRVKLFSCPPGSAIKGSAVLICDSGSSSAVIPSCEKSECAECQPNGRSFQTLCNAYDTVFIGWVLTDLDENGLFGIRTKFSALKQSVRDRRLDFNGNWRLRMKNTGQCMCPTFKKLSKYMIFMNLNGNERDLIQEALPFDMEAKYVNTLKRHCRKKSN